MAAENRGPELAAVVIALLVFTFTTIGLRCYTMGILMKRFFAEDILAVVTFIFYLAYSIFALLSIHFGLGQHVTAVPSSQHPKALLFKYLAQVFYVLIAVLVKIIVGLLLLRICSHKRWQRLTIYTLLATVVLFNLFYIFIVILQCIPVQFYWFRYQEDSVVKGKCSNKKLATIPSYASFLLNVVADFTLALLPVSFVWHSKMEFRTKCSVVAVLALGSIASFATAARIPYAKQLLSNPDYLYNFTDLAIWSTVEIGLGLSASSLATLKPLFRKLKVLASTNNTRAAQNSNGNLQSRKSAFGVGKGAFSSRSFTALGHEEEKGWSEKGERDVELGNLKAAGDLNYQSTSTLIPSPTEPSPELTVDGVEIASLFNVQDRVHHFRAGSGSYLSRPQSTCSVSIHSTTRAEYVGSLRSSPRPPVLGRGSSYRRSASVSSLVTPTAPRSVRSQSIASPLGMSREFAGLQSHPMEKVAGSYCESVEC